MTKRHAASEVAAAFTDNMIRFAELGAASQDVIGARMALGLQATHDPRLSHLEEAALMTREKLEAFSEAAAASAPSAARAGQKLAQAGLTEASAAITAGAALARAATPAAAATVGACYAMDASIRMAGAWASIASAALSAQSAALAPLHRTATRNARRLKVR
jgi:hypothetical protein